MSDDAALFTMIRLAISDPGSVTDRRDLPMEGWDGRKERESLPNWQARAVLERIRPFLREEA